MVKSCHVRSQKVWFVTQQTVGKKEQGVVVVVVSLLVQYVLYIGLSHLVLFGVKEICLPSNDLSIMHHAKYDCP